MASIYRHSNVLKCAATFAVAIECRAEVSLSRDSVLMQLQSWHMNDASSHVAKVVCSEYMLSTGCSWSAAWNCPDQPTGANGPASDDGTVGYKCCCEKEMWKEIKQAELAPAPVEPEVSTTDAGLLEEAATEDAEISGCKDENDAIQGDWMYQEDNGGKNIKLKIERNIKNLKECVYTVGNDKGSFDFTWDGSPIIKVGKLTWTFQDKSYDFWTGRQSGKIFAIRFKTPAGKELPTYYRVDGGSLLEEAATEDGKDSPIYRINLARTCEDAGMTTISTLNECREAARELTGYALITFPLDQPDGGYPTTEVTSPRGCAMHLLDVSKPDEEKQVHFYPNANGECVSNMFLCFCKEVLELPAPTPAPSSPPTATPLPACMTCTPDALCFQDVAWTMVHGFRVQPEWYGSGEIDESSCFEDVQMFLHLRQQKDRSHWDGMLAHPIPSPCWRQQTDNYVKDDLLYCR